MTKSTITITDNGGGSLQISLEFDPPAKTHGAMTPDQAAAMAAIDAIKAMCAGGDEE